MTESASASTRELVGLFVERDAFAAAARELIQVGFAPSDLSMLSSHEPVETEPRPAAESRWQAAVTAVVGEYKVIGPLVASGAIFLVGGPVAATVAALVGAAVTGVAAKEIIDEVTSAPDGSDLERAVAAGSVILWVAVRDALEETKAREVLERHGARNIHLHEAGR